MFAYSFSRTQIGLGLGVLVTLLGGCAWFGTQKPTVINVLDKAYHEDCHIPGSVQVPLAELPEFAKKLSKSQPIVTYCANYACTASGYAAEQLAKLGFTKVYAYEAGMAEWYSEGYPYEGLAEESYLTMDNKPTDGHTSAAGYNIISTTELASMLSVTKKGAVCGCGTTCH